MTAHVSLRSPRQLIQAAVAPAAQPGGFTASELGRKLHEMHGPDAYGYTVRQARYDLRKLRAKGFVRRIEGRRRYELTTVGSRALIALLVLRDKVIVPLLSAASSPPPPTLALQPRSLDQHYEKLRYDMHPSSTTSASPLDEPHRQFLVDVEAVSA